MNWGLVFAFVSEGDHQISCISIFLLQHVMFMSFDLGVGMGFITAFYPSL